MKHRLYLLLVVVFSLSLISSSAFAQGKTADKKTADKKTESAAPKGASTKAEPIDINSATKQQLMTLSGIGDAYAQKIIDNRPYRGKNDLVRKNVVPQATYDKIADQIVARQGAAAAKPETKTEKKETTKKK